VNILERIAFKRDRFYIAKGCVFPYIGIIDVDLFADLAAEKPIAAERQGQKIVVEVKSFLSQSPMRDFEMALGQYIVY
jgi:hypothetical protein